MRQPHTVTIQDLLEDVVSKQLAMSASRGGHHKSLDVVVNLQTNEIRFRVEHDGEVVSDTTSVAAAIEAYNGIDER